MDAENENNEAETPAAPIVAIRPQSLPPAGASQRLPLESGLNTEIKTGRVKAFNRAALELVHASGGRNYRADTEGDVHALYLAQKLNAFAIIVDDSDFFLCPDLGTTFITSLFDLTASPAQSSSGNVQTCILSPPEGHIAASVRAAGWRNNTTSREDWSDPAPEHADVSVVLRNAAASMATAGADSHVIGLICNSVIGQTLNRQFKDSALTTDAAAAAFDATARADTATVAAASAVAAAASAGANDAETAAVVASFSLKIESFSSYDTVYRDDFDACESNPSPLYLASGFSRIANKLKSANGGSPSGPCISEADVSASAAVSAAEAALRVAEQCYSLKRLEPAVSHSEQAAANAQRRPYVCVLSATEWVGHYTAHYTAAAQSATQPSETQSAAEWEDCSLEGVVTRPATRATLAEEAKRVRGLSREWRAGAGCLPALARFHTASAPLVTAPSFSFDTMRAFAQKELEATLMQCHLPMIGVICGNDMIRSKALRSLMWRYNTFRSDMYVVKSGPSFSFLSLFA